MLSGVSLIYGGAVNDATNVFTGGFIPALTGILPDHNTEQLNLLNDEGFSSYRTERTIVPKSGTTEFVIFIRADQFEEGWWVQDCAQQIIVRNPDRISAKDSAKCIGQFNLEKQDAICLKDPGIRVDLDARRRVCLDYQNGDKASASSTHEVRGAQESNTGHGEGSLNEVRDEVGEKPSKLSDANLYYFKPKRVKYKSWTPTALALFRELSLAVVAGTHIEEEANTKPDLTSIDCSGAKTDSGDIDFDKAENGKITCNVVGTNLDKVQLIKLRNSNPQDTATASGSLSSDFKKVTFLADDLGALNGKLYKANPLSKDGVETEGKATLNLKGPDVPILPKGQET